MASSVKNIVILAALALLLPTTLVLTVPISTNNVDTLSPKTSVKSPTPLDVNLIIHVKEADKLQMIKDGKIDKQSTKHLKKRSAKDNPNNEEHGGMTMYMTMVDTDEDGSMEELSERWGAHGGHHGHGGGGGRYHGNGDFIQIPFVPVQIPSIHSPVASVFGLFDGFLGGGNRDRDDGQHNNNWNMDGHRGGHRGWGNGGMNDWENWHGHGQNRGNNGRRPHNHNCHRHDSDDSDEDNSNEKPHTKRPISTTRPRWPSTTTLRTTRYTTRKPTTASTTTTTEYPDIDVRFGEGGFTTSLPSDDPKLDIGQELPPAV